MNRYDLPEGLVQIEITESVGDMDIVLINNIAQSLISMGFRLSMDDFGTKYSNLEMLFKFPFSIAKIDRSLVKNLESNEKSRIMLKHLISMIMELGIECVAEGAENEEQVRLLQQFGCNIIQGYFYSKPVTLDVFTSEFVEKTRNQLLFTILYTMQLLTGACSRKADNSCKKNKRKGRKMLEKIFKLKQNNTTVKTEILAGLTTFMTMAYIIALNPNLLTGFGAEGTKALWNGVFLATCIASAVGMFVMAFLANKPFALAPGMGLNSFFAVVVANIVSITGLSYVDSFQAALCIILIEGILFFILSIFNIRDKIVDAIPYGVRMGISPAIGLMLLNIGFGSNAGVYSKDGGPFYVMKDFFGALTPGLAKTNMTDGYSSMVLTVVTMFIGLFVIIILAHKGVNGAVLFGMLAACVVYWVGEAIFFGTNPFASLATASFVPQFKDMADTTLFKFDFKDFISIGWFTAISLIITFCIIDMFDTIGTLVGTASRAGMVDKEGNMPNMKEALVSDSVATVVGAVTGTSTVTTFVESASGVEAGGRTGLTAFTTGILFLACIFIAPLAAIIPAAATSSALIYVGILMLGGLKKVDFEDLSQVAPVALMLIAMPISGSIGHGIGLGLITYTVLKVFTGKAKEVSILTYAISLLFLVKFFLVV